MVVYVETFLNSVVLVSLLMVNPTEEIWNVVEQFEKAKGKKSGKSIKAYDIDQLYEIISSEELGPAIMDKYHSALEKITKGTLEDFILNLESKEEFLLKRHFSLILLRTCFLVEEWRKQQEPHY